MASLSTSAKTGLVRLCFKHPNGKAREIRLGRMSRRNAEHVLAKVHQILEDLAIGRSHGPEVTQWVAALDVEFRERLEKAGLLRPMAVPPTLEELSARCLGSAQLAASTKATYRQASKSLHRMFGARLRIDRITPADAARWQDSLVSEGLARATIGKRTNTAKSMFSRAVDWNIVGENPFSALRSGSQENADRIQYIPADLFLTVIDSMGSPKWRLLYALLRFAGLRCPSELKPLDWSDVDWNPKRKSIRVRSPKTRNHAGHQHRIVPVTRELQPYLVEAYEAAGRPSGPIFPNLESATRLRARLLKALANLGIARWPRLMQNLRASCVIDWAQSWPLPEVTRWSGHSISVAMSHYLTTKDSNFREAVGDGDWIRARIPTSVGTPDQPRDADVPASRRPSRCAHRSTSQKRANKAARQPSCRKRPRVSPIGNPRTST